MILDFVNTLKLTPSGGNLQPWKIKVSSFENHHILTFEVDRQTSTGKTDAFSFGKLISLGMLKYSCHYLAPEFQLKIVNSYIEKKTFEDFPKITVEIFEDPHKTFSSSSKLEIFKKRFTNRAWYLSKPISPDILSHLKMEFTHLNLLESEEEKKVAIDLQKKLSLIRFQNKNLFKEMLSEITLQEEKVGIPIRSLGLNQLMQQTIKFSKFFPITLPLESLYSYPINQSTILPLKHSAAIGILSQPQGDLGNWIQLGYEFMHLWLELTEKNIHLQPLGSTLILCNYFYDSKPFSFSPTHQKILHDNEFFKAPQRLIDLKLPNIFFRIGYSDVPFPQSSKKNLVSQSFFLNNLLKKI